MTAGPAVGGLLVAAVGAPLAVLVDSLTYVYSALTLRRIVLTEPATRTGVTARGLLREVTEGVRWVYRDSGLFALELSTHAWFVGHAVVGVVLAPYILRTLHLTAFQFGIIGATGGAGAILGATVTTWVGRRVGTGRTIIVCHLVTAVGVTAMVLAGQDMAPGGTVAVLVVGECLYGLAMGMSNSHQMSYRQQVTPDELQARTNTTLRSMNRGVIVVVAPLAGVLADAWGIRPMLMLAAAIFILVAAGLGASSFRDAQAPV
jgi:predicted MFS family arabinose efflux permease